MMGVLHGYLQGDKAIMFGMIASLLTCGTVAILTLVYRKKDP
jgi:hypothetical protein